MALTNQTTIVHTQSATDKSLLNTPATNIPISASNSMRIDVFEDYNRSYVKTTSTGVLCAVSLFEWLDGTKSYYKDGPLTFGTTVLYSDIDCTTPLIDTEYSTGGMAHIKTSNTGVVSGWFDPLLYDNSSFSTYRIYEPYIKKGTILYENNSPISAKHIFLKPLVIPTDYNQYANLSNIFKVREYLFGSRSINYLGGDGSNAFVISISTDNTGAVTHISNKDVNNSNNNEDLYTTSGKFVFPSQNRYSFGPQITAYSDENLTTLYSPGVLTTNYFVESKNVYYQLNIDNNGILKYNYFNFTDSTNTNYYTKGGFKDQFYPFILQEGMRLFSNPECTTSVSNISAIFGVPLSVSAVQVVTSPIEGIITNINELLPYTLGTNTFYYASNNNNYFVTLTGTQAPNTIGIAAAPVGIFNVDSSVADQFKITNGTITWQPSAGFAPAGGGFYFTNNIGSINNAFPESGYSTVYSSNNYELVIGPLSAAVIFNSTGQAFDSAGQSLLANLYLYDITDQGIVRFTIMSNTVTNPNTNTQYYSTTPLSGALTLFDNIGTAASSLNFNIGVDVNGDGAFDSITTDGSGLITLTTTTLYGTSILAADTNIYYTNNLSTGGTLYNGPYSNASTVNNLVSYYISSGTTYKIETDASGVMTITQINTFTLNGTSVYYINTLTSGSTTLYDTTTLTSAIADTSGTQDIDLDGNNDDYTVTGGTISWSMTIVYDQSWNGYYHTGTLTNGTTVLYSGQGSGASIVTNASGNYDFGSGETGWSTDGSGVISWT